MTHLEVLQELRALSNPRRAELFCRKYQTTDECFGVSVSEIRQLARKIGRHYNRAKALWQSGIHEAKILATLTYENQKLTEKRLSKLVSEIHTSDVAEYFADHIVAKTPYLFSLANKWTHMLESEMVRRTGYACVCNLAKNSKTQDNNYFEKHLVIIEIEIKNTSNWVKEGQNNAIIAIGSRNRILNRKALEAAGRIGKVTIDYGESSSKTPDARDVLLSERVQKKLG